MIFKCKVCPEKDKRIADLKEQIAHQKAIINPPLRINHYEIEQDFVMNGATQEELPTSGLIDTESQRKIMERLQAIQLEQEQMLSGDTIEIPIKADNG